MRKLLARIRKLLAGWGLNLRPLTDPRTGGYAGFMFVWANDSRETLRGAIADVAHPKGSARFFVHDERDLIQKVHLRGNFYEEEELELIGRYFAGGTFLDVGANVGNHSVFAVCVLGADAIVAFEPNRLTSRLLEVNLALNGLSHLSTVHRLGLSDQAGISRMIQLDNNLGSARLSNEATSGETVTLVVGDELLDGLEIGFVKVDVEGHELQVLRGISQMLMRCAPPVFVEIEDACHDEVYRHMASLGYRHAEEFVRYGGRQNSLFIAADRMGGSCE